MATRSFTPAQASAITGLPLKSINRAIEDRTVPVKNVRKGHAQKRYIPYAGLICLELQAEGLGKFPLQLRKDVFKRVVHCYRAPQLRYATALLIDIQSARRRVLMRLLDLRRATRVVVSDPEIMGGVPVFKGTRVPVYAIADMLAAGTPREDVLDGYPSISEEMLQIASVYAEAYPKRGRPPATPWARNKPIRRTVKALATGAGDAISC